MYTELSVLVFDLNRLYREEMRNFLLAAGFKEVDVAATETETIAMLHRKSYRYVLIGLSRPLSRGLALAADAERLQQGARILGLIEAKDQPLLDNGSVEFIIKESALPILLELMAQEGV